MTADTSSRKRRKTKTKLHDEDLRKNCVSTRLTDEELKLLDSRRGTLSRGEFVRYLALDKPLPNIAEIPEINREKWIELSRSASNIHQIAHALNRKQDSELENLCELARRELQVFRLALLGMKEE